MRVVLIDDQALVRHGTQQLLVTHGDFRIVGEAETAEQALAVVRACRPDLILLELRLASGDPFALIETLHREYPAMRVVVLTHSDDDADLVRALRAGADGFISKRSSALALVAELQAVMREEVGLSRALTTRLAHRLREESASGPSIPAPPSLPLGSGELSPRELEVLRCIAGGASNKEIARMLSISQHTVRTHVTNVLTKLNLASRVQAATFALRHGIALQEPLAAA